MSEDSIKQKDKILQDSANLRQLRQGISTRFSLSEVVT